MVARAFRGGRRPSVVALALAVGLTIGWLPAVSSAQQTPDGWSKDHRAVLRSGLTADLDFQAEPGVSVRAAAGTLDGATGVGTRRAPAYADGVRPGAPAQTFEITPDRPHADGAWRTMGTLQLTFSRPVRNPRLHASGLAGAVAGPGGTSTAVRLSVIGGTPVGPALTARSPWSGWTVDGGALAPAGGDGSGDATADPAGSLELDGTFDTATFRIEQRSTATGDGSAKPVQLRQAFTVTLDETVGSAPEGYGNASHLVSDLFLGADAAGTTPGRIRLPADGRVHVTGPVGGTGPTPVPPEVQPGRTAHPSDDATIDFPSVAAIGGYYDVTVPVSPGQDGATLAGWIDFDRNGRFDASERAQVDIAPGTTSATLEWTVPPSVSAGDTWARLRIARDPAQLVSAGGFADSGEVEDQTVRLAVGAPRPEITSPVGGAVVGDVRPQFHGGGAVAGATVEVQEGAVALCQATVDGNGGWSCRPGAALAQGAHTVVAAETTGGGVMLHSEPLRFAVSTTPPPVPVLTVPEYSNDPDLLMTGTAGPGTTVAVVDGNGTEVCRTRVRADRSWSCLPVEDLAEGRHVLTAVAQDPAGNRTSGEAVTLIVDTVPPAKPLITSPPAGAELAAVRARLAGTAEPGATVTVAVSGRAGVVCSAVAAVDGSWGCYVLRDLPVGEQVLTATATDRAGNATAGDGVPVRVEAEVGASPTSAPGPSPSPSASAAPLPSPSPSLSVGPSPSLGADPTVGPPSSLGADPTVGLPSSLGADPTVGPPSSLGADPTMGPPPSVSPAPSLSPSSPSVSPAPSLSPSPSATVLPWFLGWPWQLVGPSDAPLESAGPTPPAAGASEVATGSPGRPLAAPPTKLVMSRRSPFGGWRTLSCAVLLTLTGALLVTRRVLTRCADRGRR
ncbi:Ig-like domain-containing protein [Kitasatospora sp. NPDC052896]|uniref:Ig-like domain-containing protein n=1 Tax=Kitasatospora sp. NPDC052896 TaxID=3364061 RepID=UPI0037C8D744